MQIFYLNGHFCQQFEVPRKKMEYNFQRTIIRISLDVLKSVTKDVRRILANFFFSTSLHVMLSLHFQEY